MITTTVVWPQDGLELNPSEEQRAMLDAMAQSLCPDMDAQLSTVSDDSGNSIIATRQWPTVEIAQAWVDYVLANFNASSAVVNPE